MKKVFKYLFRCIDEPSVRSNLALFSGLLLNGFYIVFNIIFGIAESDAWFVGVAAYYLLMLSMRYAVFDGGEVSLYDIGFLMLILSFPMSGMIFYKIFRRCSYVPSGFLRSVFAVYFLYSVIRAFFGLRSFKRTKEEQSFTLNAVRLSSALFSFFSFQSALFPGLGITESSIEKINVISGVFVSISVFILSVFMVLKGGKSLKKRGF